VKKYILFHFHRKVQIFGRRVIISATEREKGSYEHVSNIEIELFESTKVTQILCSEVG